MYKKNKYNGHLRISMHIVEHNQMAVYKNWKWLNK